MLFKKKTISTNQLKEADGSKPTSESTDLAKEPKSIIHRIKFNKLLGLIIIIAIAGLIIGVALYLIGRNDTTSKQPDPAIVAKQLSADYETRKKGYEAAPKTAQEQLVGIQKTLSDQHVDMNQPIDIIVKNIKDNPMASEAMIQAALVGAQAKDDNAKKYAAVGLQLISKDDYVRKINAGLIARLTAISKGDYSVATQ